MDLLLLEVVNHPNLMVVVHLWVVVVEALLWMGLALLVGTMVVVLGVVLVVVLQ
jgi:hypothetical protein